jgi:hypothetical protein
MERVLEEALAYFLELRLRCRGNPESMAMVDRCLSLLARAQTADRGELKRLEAEVDALRRELLDRLGPPPNRLLH